MAPGPWPRPRFGARSCSGPAATMATDSSSPARVTRQLLYLQRWRCGVAAEMACARRASDTMEARQGRLIRGALAAPRWCCGRRRATSPQLRSCGGGSGEGGGWALVGAHAARHVRKVATLRGDARRRVMVRWCDGGRVRGVGVRRRGAWRRGGERAKVEARRRGAWRRDGDAAPDGLP